MESELIQNFIRETNTDIDTIFLLLQKNFWNFDLAMEDWESKKFGRLDKTKYVKMSLGILMSTENKDVIDQAQVEKTYESSEETVIQCYWKFGDKVDYSFCLPDVNIFDLNFKNYLEKDLVENSTLITLQNCERLNWWLGIKNGNLICDKLWPLQTIGDGNCLLHAASLAIWGFHDRLLILRSALHAYLTTSNDIPALYRRWRWQQTKINEQAGLVCSEAEWRQEWGKLLDMASVIPRRNEYYSSESSNQQSGNLKIANTYESLEEFHVFVLAHILRRPIIIFSDVVLRDMKNEPLAPIQFGGIYLPLELPFEYCCKSPILLSYDMAHFSALLLMDDDEDITYSIRSAIPVIDADGCLLPIHFSVDPGFDFNWNDQYDQTILNQLLPTEKEQIALLKTYLNIVEFVDTDVIIAAASDHDSEEDIEKRFCEVSDSTDADNLLFGTKNRAAKQLQSVAKQFGSIGKSVSKRLRRNFASITKPYPKPKKQEGNRVKMICTEIEHVNHPYYMNMMKSYLKCVYTRFFKEQELKEKISLNTYQMLTPEVPVKCINTDCIGYGTATTSYMCVRCFNTQRNEELHTFAKDFLFGIGKSKFYRHSGNDLYSALKNMSVGKSNNKSARNLQLSKSIFYCDTPVNTVVSSNIENNDNNLNVIDNNNIIQPTITDDIHNVIDSRISNNGENTDEEIDIAASQPSLHQIIQNQYIAKKSKIDRTHEVNSDINKNADTENMILLPCKGNNCYNFASVDTQYYCSKCLQK